MNSLLFADLPPYVMCQGQPALARSMNFEGLKRRGFSAEQIQTVKAIYKILYRDGLTLEKSIQAIDTLGLNQPQGNEVTALMSEFLRSVSPQRGIVR
jgi:UDP-N-acetylglucosamine acyltransferase